MHSPYRGAVYVGVVDEQKAAVSLGARIFPDMFSLAMAHKAFVGEELADPALRARFEKTVQSFLSLAEAAKHYPCMKHAWVEFLSGRSGASASGSNRPKIREHLPSLRDTARQANE